MDVDGPRPPGIARPDIRGVGAWERFQRTSDGSCTEEIFIASSIQPLRKKLLFCE